MSWRIAKKYHEVYVYEGDRRNAKKLPDDMLDQIDFYSSHHRAGQEIDWVYEKYIKKSEAEVLNVMMHDARAHFAIKKNILLALGQLFHSFILAEKFVKQYKIEDPIDFIPAPFPHSLYRIISQKKDLLPANVHIPELYINTMRYREAIQNNLFRAKLILYPLWISLRMNLRKVVVKSKKNYRYGIHVWNSWISSVSEPCRISFFEDKDCVNPENALYIIDGDVSKNNLLKVKSNGYECCAFKEMLRSHPAPQYLKEMFLRHLKLSAQCFFASKNGTSLLTESYLRFMQQYILWEIFYTRYYVDLFITLQEPGTICRTLAQKKHGAQCIFILWSTIPEIVFRKDMNTHADSYCGFMVYDAMLSSRLSNEYFKKNNNCIEKYIDIGVLRSDVIFQVKHNAKLKNDMKEKLGIPIDKRIIGFFDTNVGKDGMFTNREGLQMLDDGYRLLESNDKYFFVFRTRGHYHHSDDSDVKKSFNRLIQHKRVFFMNKLETFYYGFEVMGLCDLVIAAFSGSAPLESVAGGIRTLCYAPEKFDKDVFVMNNAPRFYVRGYERLKEHAEYWLQCSEDEFLNFQNNYVKNFVDEFCDGQSKKRLIQILKNA